MAIYLCLDRRPSRSLAGIAAQLGVPDLGRGSARDFRHRHRVHSGAGKDRRSIAAGRRCSCSACGARRCRRSGSGCGTSSPDLTGLRRDSDEQAGAGDRRAAIAVPLPRQRPLAVQPGEVGVQHAVRRASSRPRSARDCTTGCRGRSRRTGSSQKDRVQRIEFGLPNSQGKSTGRAHLGSERTERRLDSSPGRLRATRSVVPERRGARRDRSCSPGDGNLDRPALGSAVPRQGCGGVRVQRRRAWTRSCAA